MAILNNIPRNQHGGFRELLIIENQTFKDIIDGLSLAPPTSSVIKLADSVSKIKSLSAETVEKVLYSVGGLIYYLEKEPDIKIDQDVLIKELIENVWTIIEKDKDFVDFKEADKQIFNERLSELLKSERIYYAAKSMGLKGENSNVFIQSKIITDIRPIFSLNVKETPKAGIVIHNLHVHFSSSDEGAHRDIYFSLDSDDIKELKKLLERAEDKANSLKNIFDKSNVANLD